MPASRRELASCSRQKSRTPTLNMFFHFFPGMFTRCVLAHDTQQKLSAIESSECDYICERAGLPPPPRGEGAAGADRTDSPARPALPCRPPRRPRRAPARAPPDREGEAAHACEVAVGVLDVRPRRLPLRSPPQASLRLLMNSRANYKCAHLHLQNECILRRV